MPGEFLENTDFLSIDASCIESIKDKSRNSLQETLFNCYQNTQPIQIYKSASHEVTLEDPCYDSNWSGKSIKKEVNREYFQESISLPAIVIYNNPKDLKRLIQDEDELAHLRLLNTPQTIRLKFKTLLQEALLTIEEKKDIFSLSGVPIEKQVEHVLAQVIKAKKIKFEGEEYMVKSDLKKTMFFGSPIWYEIIIQKVN